MGYSQADRWNLDHPRMCGEHGGIGGAVDVNWGSSPHVRGAPDDFKYFAAALGIIPACAGSTSAKRSRLKPSRDHPRMCGEHCRCPAVPCPNPGSSPHVRGAR